MFILKNKHVSLFNLQCGCGGGCGGGCGDGGAIACFACVVCYHHGGCGVIGVGCGDFGVGCGEIGDGCGGIVLQIKIALYTIIIFFL